MKPRITSEQIFVCRKSGYPNGYGKSPKLAFNDQKAKIKRQSDRAKSLNIKADEIRRDLSVKYKKRYEDALLGFNRLKKTWFEPSGTDEWVMMACIVNNLEPFDAIAKMRTLGARFCGKEGESAARVSGLIEAWRQKLGISSPTP